MQRSCMAGVDDEALRLEALWDRNVLEQAQTACATTVVRDAWDRGQAVIVHGWIYGLHNGLLEDLRISAGCAAEVAPAYGMALGALKTRYDAIRKKGQP